MTTTFKPTVPGRPPSFDARVLAYRPGLISLAGRLGFRGEEREDVVVDTIMTVLHRWASFREDGGWWNWLELTMRSCAQERRKAARRRISTVSDVDEKYLRKVSVDPGQERYMEVSDTLRHMTGRDGQALMQLAMGEDLGSIGGGMGISRERARQLCERQRAKLVTVREVA